jgi:uncharacterized protein
MATVDQSVPQPPRGRRLRSRDALVVVGLAVLLLVLFEGDGIRASGEEMQPGLERDVVLAVGKPAGWVTDRLPFDEAGDKAWDWLSADDELGESGGFDQPARGSHEGPVSAVSPDSFDPVELGEKAGRLRLRELLVTGDSLAMPLDLELARSLAGDEGVKVERDPHVGTGVSKSGFVDWGKLSTRQARKREPDAVVVFIGANDGFPMPGPGGKQVQCCGPAWAAEYASRVRRMMNTYRRRGKARVYWLTLPLPRQAPRRRIARAVNAAIEVASVPFRSQVRVLDLEQLFTPDGRYQDTVRVDGRERIVREPDGIHLNGTGARVAAELVLAAIRRDFRD